MPIEPQPPVSPTTQLVCFTLTDSVLIDSAGLAEIGRLLSSALGPVRFSTLDSDFCQHQGATIEEVSRKELYGNRYIQRFWIRQASGTAGIEIKNDEREPVRIDVPDSSTTIVKDLKNTLRKYRSPYSFFAEMPHWSLIFWFLIIPWGLAFWLRPIVREAFPTDVRAPQSPQHSSKSPPPAGPSAPSWRIENLYLFLAALVIGLLFGRLLDAFLSMLFMPFRPFKMLAFPRVAFDLLSNERRNDFAKWIRRILYPVPVTLFFGTLFG